MGQNRVPRRVPIITQTQRSSSTCLTRLLHHKNKPNTAIPGAQPPGGIKTINIIMSALPFSNTRSLFSCFSAIDSLPRNKQASMIWAANFRNAMTQAFSVNQVLPCQEPALASPIASQIALQCALPKAKIAPEKIIRRIGKNPDNTRKSSISFGDLPTPRMKTFCLMKFQFSSSKRSLSPVREFSPPCHCCAALRCISAFIAEPASISNSRRVNTGASPKFQDTPKRPIPGERLTPFPRPRRDLVTRGLFVFGRAALFKNGLAVEAPCQFGCYGRFSPSCCFEEGGGQSRSLFGRGVVGFWVPWVGFGLFCGGVC